MFGLLFLPLSQAFAALNQINFIYISFFNNVQYKQLYLIHQVSPFLQCFSIQKHHSQIFHKSEYYSLSHTHCRVAVSDFQHT